MGQARLVAPDRGDLSESKGMNRIKLDPATGMSLPQDSKLLKPIEPWDTQLPAKGLLHQHGGQEGVAGVEPSAQHAGAPREHVVFVPLHYEKNYAYPLIVWLHGSGSDQHELPRVMYDISIRNYLAVAPRGPERDWDTGFCWPQTENCIETACDSALRAIDDACGRFNIASHRIYLAGQGDGGEMAFRLAFQRPELFAGVISVNGRLPENYAPLARLKSCRDLPVLWSHGRDSDEFSESQLCQQLRLMHIAGFSVTLRQYPCGSTMMPQVFSDIDLWIMDAINGTDLLNGRTAND